MPKAPRPPSPAEVLRQHYAAVAALVGSGADEPAIGAALTAAEAAGLDRTALRMAVREGALDRERRAEVACTLDYYRHMMDRPEPAPAAEVEAAPPGVLGPRAAGSGDGEPCQC